MSKEKKIKMAAVIGLGFVGSALHKSFALKKVEPLGGYDRYKNGGIGSLEECLDAPILFLCLPTLYDEVHGEYDKSAIKETVANLANYEYQGVIVIKSTVEPGTTDELSKKYPALTIMHNPEFLSAATAFHDFHNQTHIVLGQGIHCSDESVKLVHDFYHKYYPTAEISECKAIESESMKSFVNSFYSVKIQFFNELYLLCQKQGSDFEVIKSLMLKNDWINPMHTQVPGHDGKLSYGGACFPKDTNALLQTMKNQESPHQLLEGCVRERNVLREETSSNKLLDNLDRIRDTKAPNGYKNGIRNGHSEVMNGYSNGHTENGHSNGHLNGVENGHFNGVLNGDIKKDLSTRKEVINGHY